MAQPPRGPDQPLSSQKSPHRHRHQSTTAPTVVDGYDEETAAGPPPRRRAPQRAPSFDVSPNTPLNPTVQDLSRKKSLIKPERNRINKDNPLYNYHKHAQRMQVLPSTTGIDNTIEEGVEGGSQTSSTTLKKPYIPVEQSTRRNTKGSKGPSRKLTRADRERRQELVKAKLAEEDFEPPSIWTVYCTMITFWAPDPLLRLFGLPKKEQQRAWREKIALISIILLFCLAVGFLTFGFTEVVCGIPAARLKVNSVDTGYMIINGKAYNLDGSRHPAAEGIPANADVLYDLPVKYGGYDGSFLFQNVNGQCKGLITAAPNSDVPTNADGDLAWYFPCTPYKQDGSSAPNFTEQYYLGYACHTTAAGRDAYYSLEAQGDVYFTWDDIKNSSRNLMVYSGNVLDLDLIAWFNTSQVSYPAVFDEYRTTANAQVRGVDVTHMFQGTSDKKMAKCLSEIIRVGSVDTETVGCIASKVVLYVSLIFIITLVMIKFFLALFFHWFLSKKLGARYSKDSAARTKDIEDWSNDIFTAPPKLKDAMDRGSKRGSFFPTTSRFTSPYAAEKRQSTNRPAPMTMGSQSSTSKLLPPSPMYQGDNASRGSLYAPNVRSSLNPLSSSGDRGSTIFGTEPNSTIVDQVVPQPPPEFQPYGFPLVHTICLVTAYSEGTKGIRNTLNSVATTDYPNSHKLMLVICDGMVRGEGENITTPECVLTMMKEHVVAPELVEPFSYVAVATGRKRHNMAKVYAGFYDYEEGGEIPLDKQQRVPMIVIVKCGTESEAEERKPGNRGKRDSQIILMGFLQKVMFDERMTELEYEMFSGIWSITGISPEFYEVVLMVDADTKLFPDSVTHMTAAMVNDPDIMGLCGETKIANKTDSWVSMIQVFEYFISHHLSKSFESVFGGVTCLPGCFCMYRIKAPKGAQNYWVPILANPDVVEHYSENVVDTLHKKNLLLLGEDRYLSTLMLKTFPKRKQVFVPQAVCKTLVPDKFSVLLSQRRRWINSTIHNLMELVLVRDLCGTFCFSMQFVVMIDLIGTVVLPAAISFTIYLIVISIVKKPVPVIPLVLLGLILGLPAVLIVLTANRWSYVVWMIIYLMSLPIWNFVLPVYAFWKFDDFSWGDTRKVEGETKKNNQHDEDGEFDSTQIVMRRWKEFEKEKMIRNFEATYSQPSSVSGGSWNPNHPYASYEHQNL